MPGGGEPSRAARRVLRSASGKAATSSAVELEEIEEVIDEAGAALVGGLLHEADVGNAVWTHGAEFTVEIGRLDGKFRQGGGGCGIFGCPVEPGAGEELDLAGRDAGGHSVAVELNFVDPERPGGRLGCELAELRLDPFWRRHGASVARPRDVLVSFRSLG
jgi:hypothetical protein